MNQITLTAQVRAEQGSKAAGRLRRAGKIPGVIKRISGESTLIALDAHDYEMAMRGHHGDQLLVRIALGEVTLSALLRELQHDVVTGQVIHADFGEVDMGHTVRVEIAINLVGTPDGVKNANGVLEQERSATSSWPASSTWATSTPSPPTRTRSSPPASPPTRRSSSRPWPMAPPPPSPRSSARRRTRPPPPSPPRSNPAGRARRNEA